MKAAAFYSEHTNEFAYRNFMIPADCHRHLTFLIC